MASKRRNIHRPLTVITVSRAAARRLDAIRAADPEPTEALKALFARGKSLMAKPQG